MEQVTEVLLQYLEILLLEVAVVQDILMVVLQEDQVGLVVVEDIIIHQGELEIAHQSVHLKEILVVMEEQVLVAVAVVLAVVVTLELVLEDMVVQLVVEHLIQ